MYLHHQNICVQIPGCQVQYHMVSFKSTYPCFLLTKYYLMYLILKKQQKMLEMYLHCPDMGFPIPGCQLQVYMILKCQEEYSEEYLHVQGTTNMLEYQRAPHIHLVKHLHFLKQNTNKKGIQTHSSLHTSLQAYKNKFGQFSIYHTLVRSRGKTN